MMSKTEAFPINVSRLNNVIACRREIARVYREGRQGKIETQDMTRFVSVLQTLVNVLRDSDLEKRIEALEGK